VFIFVISDLDWNGVVENSVVETLDGNGCEQCKILVVVSDQLHIGGCSNVCSKSDEDILEIGINLGVDFHA